MGGGHRSIVTGVHRLEHVQRLATAALSDDDPLRAHSEGVDHEIADSYLALAFDIGWPGFQSHNVVLAKLKFGRVFDRDDALIVRNERREHVQHRCFSGAGTAGDQDVQSRFDTRFEERRHLGGECPEPDQVLDRERVLGELTDRDRWPVERNRGNDRVHAGAIR